MDIDHFNHPFFQTQLRYDHAPEAASIPAYTRALWDRQHRRISRDFARLKSVEKARILDVGCGPGHIADSQAEHIELYLGIDPSMTELRRGKSAPNRHFVHGAAEALDFVTPGSFDIATMISVLDHCIDWQAALNRVSEALRPGGIMLVLMENADHAPGRVRRWLGREVEHHDHMHFLTLGDVETALGDEFETIDRTTFGYGFGLHALGAKLRLPVALFEALAPAMDTVGRALMPGSGQVLYAWLRKRGDECVAKHVFRNDLPCKEGAILDGMVGSPAPHRQHPIP